MEEVPESDHRTRGVDRGNSGGGGQNHVLQAWQRQHHHIHSYSLQYGKTTIIILYGKLDIYRCTKCMFVISPEYRYPVGKNIDCFFLSLYNRCLSCLLIPVLEIT